MCKKTGNLSHHTSFLYLILNEWASSSAFGKICATYMTCESVQYVCELSVSWWVHGILLTLIYIVCVCCRFLSYAVRDFSPVPQNPRVFLVPQDRNIRKTYSENSDQIAMWMMCHCQFHFTIHLSCESFHKVSVVLLWNVWYRTVSHVLLIIIITRHS